MDLPNEAAPFFKRLVSCFSPRKQGFQPRSVYAGSVVDQLASGQACLRVLQVSCQRLAQIFHTLNTSFIYQRRYITLYNKFLLISCFGDEICLLQILGRWTRKWLWKVIIGYGFQYNLTNLRYTCFTHYIHNGVHSDWLALINHAASSPAILLQVQENLLLLCSNTPPTSVNSICPDMSSPLLRHHNENKHSPCSLFSVPQFSGKNILVIIQKNDL